MAFNKKVTLWSLIGSLWTAWWLFIIAWITWFDYPRDTNIYDGFIGNGTQYWHELALPISIWMSGLLFIVIFRFWWALASFLESFRTMEALPDGQLVFVRRKKK